MTVQTFIITTVPNPAGPGAIYQIDGVNKPVLNLVRGGVYTFTQSAASNTTHPIAFKDGTGAVYTVGVTSTGVPGQAGARTVIAVAANAPSSLRYYCVTHGNNMGNSIVVSDIQTINIGNLVNDGLGDDLRTAFRKVNENFTTLNASLTVTASNVGTIGEGIFKQKTGVNLEFKNLIPGTKITLDGGADFVRINSSQPDAFTSITTNSGAITALNTADPTTNTLGITVQGAPTYSVPTVGQTGRNIRVVKTANKVISIDTVLDLNQILLAYDFGPVAGDFEHPIQMSLAASNIDFGSALVPGRLNLDLGVI